MYLNVRLAFPIDWVQEGPIPSYPGFMPTAVGAKYRSNRDVDLLFFTAVSGRYARIDNKACLPPSANVASTGNSIAVPRDESDVDAVTRGARRSIFIYTPGALPGRGCWNGLLYVTAQDSIST